MNWMWFAAVARADASDAFASATVTSPGPTDDEVLAVWLPDRRPRMRVAKIDMRIVDPGGGPALVSLVLAPPHVRLPFDDTAVQQARRDVLSRRPPRSLSTLLRGDSLFGGAVTVDPLDDDPFARIFPARLLMVTSGLFGAVAAHPGPDIERHGSGAPWPYPRFAPATP